MTLPLLSTGDVADQAWLFFANNAATTAVVPQNSVRTPVPARPAALGDIIAAIYAATMVALPAPAKHRLDFESAVDRLSPPAIIDFGARAVLPAPVQLPDLPSLLPLEVAEDFDMAASMLWFRSLDAVAVSPRPPTYGAGAAAPSIRSYGATGSSDNWQVLEVATPPTGSTPQQVRSIGSLKFERLVAKALNGVDIEEPYVLFAAEAISDALKMTRRYDLRDAQNIFMTEDGVLTLQWRKGDRGAAMIFTGEGKVAISTASTEKSYSQSPTSINVSDALPIAFISTLQSLV